MTGLIAGLLQLQYGAVLSASHYRNIKVPRAEGGGKTAGSGAVRVYVGLGRKDGMTKRSLAELLSSLLSIPDHAVDRIELFERFSLADLPADAAHEAVRLSKRRANVPHIHLDVKSGAGAEKRSIPLHGTAHSHGGHPKKSSSRKMREDSRREAFFREKDNKKKRPVSSGGAAAYKKRPVF